MLFRFRDTDGLAVSDNNVDKAVLAHKMIDSRFCFMRHAINRQLGVAAVRLENLIVAAFGLVPPNGVQQLPDTGGFRLKMGALSAAPVSRRKKA